MKPVDSTLMHFKCNKTQSYVHY